MYRIPRDLASSTRPERLPKSLRRAFILDETPDERVHDWGPAFERVGVSDAYDQARARMCSLLDHCPDTRYLVHADLLKNCLVEDTGVTAVFDWGCGMYGDYLYDLAVVTFLAPQFQALKGIDVRSQAFRHYRREGAGIESFDERLTCYQIHFGLDAMRVWAATGNDEQLLWTADRTGQLVADLELAPETS